MSTHVYFDDGSCHATIKPADCGQKVCSICVGTSSVLLTFISSITTHLLTTQNDPFNRSPLTVDEVGTCAGYLSVSGCHLYAQLLPAPDKETEVANWVFEKTGLNRPWKAR